MKKSVLCFLFILFSSFFLLFTIEINAQIVFGLNSGFRFLKGKDAISLSSAWYNPGFNDSGWTFGNTPFRYGDGTGGTELSDMQFSYSTLYLRGNFMVTNASNIEQITINADFDDGFIIWINGIVAKSVNAPASPSYNSFATDLRESGTISTYNIQADPLLLTEGINIIAVQAFNISLESSDFYFNMSITAEPALPRINQKPIFNREAGFYTNPFILYIFSPSTEYQIAYTLDGSNPENSPTRIQTGVSANILIDPLSNQNRPLTPAVIVRASLHGAGMHPSFPEGRTYFFAAEVSNQKFPGGDWPNTNVNGQIIDLPMDSKVVNDPRYASLMEFSLKEIPSFSIITDIKNLFDPEIGLYVNAEGHGEEWERECSVELINPDGSDGFQVNAGLRIRGGWSRHDNYPKHAFRLFFRSEYGTAKLNYPLFGEEGTTKFNKIDLRCEQNYSWANAGSGGPSIHNTAVREVFSRDTQGEMGQPYSRSRYYHLYLNGMYWGLFQTQERTEANFASSYLGGDDTDYDVVKVNTENYNYVIEATDGSLVTWQNIYILSNSGFASNLNYYKLEGKDINGNRIKGAPVLVDIDNLIDYMLVIFYTGNFDSPTSSFGDNKGCNNFYAIYNSKLKNRGFTFYAHDAEHTLMSDVVETGTGLYEDRVNLARRTDGKNMLVSDFQRFHPQWLHEKLTKNPEYRIRFADRAYNYLRAGNVLSPEACLARFDARASQIDFAIISESARWGDSKGTYPVRTKDNHWIPELNKVRTVYFPVRSDILKDQLKTANLLPLVESSIIKVDGNAIQSEYYPFQNSVNIGFQNPNAGGEVYYTLDNTDPRLAGGSKNPAAIKWQTGSDYEVNHSAIIKTRVYLNGVWSALSFTKLLKSNEDYSNLKVTEIMYHPPDVINGTDTIFGTSLEFIEFKNIGSTSINISGMKLDSAIRCVFPANILLGPQQFYVAASKPGTFTDFYGFPPSTNFSGNLSNGGEYVLLTDPQGNPVISFTYNDNSPWPVCPDGGGCSLNSVEKNPTGDPDNYTYWKASGVLNGTPFADDPFADSIDKSDIDDVRVTIYPNPADNIVTISINPERKNENIRVKIFSLSGSLMYDNKLNAENTISLNKFNIGPGIYLVRLEGEKLLITRKLVVTY